MTAIFCWLVAISVALSVAAAEGPAPTPRIDFVDMLSPQPHESDPAVIWYDDFNGEPKRYTESQGENVDGGYGGQGKAMLGLYEKGSQGKGNRKVFFGDSPTGKVVRKGETFDDVYWRVYVKHQAGWLGGGPDKLSRATSMAAGNWSQAMISHVWSAGGSLTLDPASGIRGDAVVTTKYNDFANLRWLGNKPTAKTQLYTDELGRWVCIEARAKLNTPGKKDGINQLWIDCRLESERTGLDWRGSYSKHGINALFLESYWNKGSPVEQRRWLDNFVISTKPIGPVVTHRNPGVRIVPARIESAEHHRVLFQVEIGAEEGRQVVWREEPVPDTEVNLDATMGQCVGPLAGSPKGQLAPDTVYYCRVRQTLAPDKWGEWSPWHQPFRTAE